MKKILEVKNSNIEQMERFISSLSKEFTPTNWGAIGVNKHGEFSLSPNNIEYREESPHEGGGVSLLRLNHYIDLGVREEKVLTWKTMSEHKVEVKLIETFRHMEMTEWIGENASNLSVSIGEDASTAFYPTILEIAGSISHK